VEAAAKQDRLPTNEELADALDLTPSQVQMVRYAVNARQHGGQMPGDDDPEVYDLVSDPNARQPEEEALSRDEIHVLMKLLEVIDERDATILKLRYGLDGEEPKTLSEVGKAVGLTRERVRQIEHQSLERLNEWMESDTPLSGLRYMVSAEEKKRRDRRRKFRR